MKLLSWLTFFIIFFTTCAKKENEVNDPIWRIESLKMADATCNIFRKCSESSFNNVKPALKNLATAKMEAGLCLEAHKKSRVYLLKGYPPEVIKRNAVDCFKRLQKLKCHELRHNALKNINSCEIILKIQNGESIQQ